MGLKESQSVERAESHAPAASSSDISHSFDEVPSEPCVEIPPVAMERFRAAARGLLSATGIPRDDRLALEDEIVDHLLTAFESNAANGLTADLAMRRALETFGEPRRIRRQFLLRGLARDARAAVRLPRPWALLVVLDAALAVIRPVASGDLSPLASPVAMWIMVKYLAGAIALLWIGHSAFRLSWRLCRRFMRGPDVEWELASGLGVFAVGFGLLLWTGPGYVFPAICDLIDRSLGRDSAVALTTLTVGLSVSLAALVRDLSRTSDELHAG